MATLYYPRLIRRVQAILIDSLLVAGGIFAVVFLIPSSSLLPGLKAALLVLVPVALEPALVCLTGGTIGHHLLKIKVTGLSGEGNIGFPASLVRFVVKSAFGWVSLVLVLTTRRHQALHDLVARSLVVHQLQDGLPSAERLLERPSLDSRFQMPSGARRSVVTVAYFTGAYVLYAAAVPMIFSDACLTSGDCGAAEVTIVTIAAFAWIAAEFAIIVLGCLGLLYGARRSVLSDEKKRIADSG